jgi:hypothetical protein
MIAASSTVKVLVATKPVDFRPSTTARSNAAFASGCHTAYIVTKIVVFAVPNARS